MTSEEQTIPNEKRQPVTCPECKEGEIHGEIDHLGILIREFCTKCDFVNEVLKAKVALEAAAKRA